MDTLTTEPPGTSAQQNMGNDLELARRLHRSLLPPRTNTERADVSLICREYHLLGGDYGTAYWLNDNLLMLCVCDVTGHGIASALLAARINTFVRFEVKQGLHPCQILNDLNGFLTRNFTGMGIFATFFCALVDWQEGRIQYAGAGHPPALLRGKDGGIKRLESGLPLLGVFDPFPETCILGDASLHSGDVLILYTDGLVEARNEQGDFYDLESLESSLIDLPESGDAERVQSHLLDKLEAFTRKSRPDDDLLLLTTCLK